MDAKVLQVDQITSVDFLGCLLYEVRDLLVASKIFHGMNPFYGLIPSS